MIDNLPDFVYRIGGADFVFPSSKYIDRVIIIGALLVVIITC